jgi:hypothetical protein
MRFSNIKPMKNILWLALAVVVAVTCLIVARALRLSYPVAVALYEVATFSALFPFMKRWIMPEARFAPWALVAVIWAALSWVLMTFAFR